MVQVLKYLLLITISLGESCHICVSPKERVIYDDEILVSKALFCEGNRMPPTRTKRDTPCYILITHPASKEPSAIYLSRDAQRSPPGYSQMSISPTALYWSSRLNLTGPKTSSTRTANFHLCIILFLSLMKICFFPIMPALSPSLSKNREYLNEVEAKLSPACQHKLLYQCILPSLPQHKLTSLTSPEAGVPLR